MPLVQLSVDCPNNFIAVLLILYGIANIRDMEFIIPEGCFDRSSIIPTIVLVEDRQKVAVVTDILIKQLDPYLH